MEELREILHYFLVIVPTFLVMVTVLEFWHTHYYERTNDDKTTCKKRKNS